MLTYPLKQSPENKNMHLSFKILMPPTTSRVPHFAKESAVFMYITQRFIFPTSLQTSGSIILAWVCLEESCFNLHQASPLPAACTLVFPFVFLAMPFGNYFFMGDSIAMSSPPLHLFTTLWQFSIPFFKNFVLSSLRKFPGTTWPGTIFSCNVGSHLFSYEETD